VGNQQLFNRILKNKNQLLKLIQNLIEKMNSELLWHVAGD